MASNGGISTNILVIRALHLPGGTSDINSSLDSDNTVSFSCDQITITDNYSPKFSEETAYGKMDPMVFYQNTTRKLQFKITTFANEDLTSRYSPKKLTEKIQKFQMFQYPRYLRTANDSAPNISAIAGGAIAAPPLFQVLFYKEGMGENAGKKYKNYKDVKGYMSGLTIQPGSSVVSIGEGMLEPVAVEEGSKGQLLESGWQIEFELGVLHDKPPGWTGSKWAGSEIFTIGLAGIGAEGVSRNKINSDPEETIDEWKKKNVDELAAPDDLQAQIDALQPIDPIEPSE